MNRREMKKQVKKTIASYLVNILTHPDERTSLIDEIKLDVFRDGYTGTEAEVRRLQNILYELHREAFDYEV